MKEKALEVLRSVFGYREFRPPQDEIVHHVASGGDAFVLLPTGGGKSLCYQIPALLRDGVAIVVSPLIALMDDQVAALRQNGVAAAALHSGNKMAWADEADLREGRIRLAYVAPERLLTERFLELMEQSNISLFAIDEAHCVSQWGHDFRPEYLAIGQLAERFPHIPRMALTATADGPTRKDIVEKLHLENARWFTKSFDRPNIRYRIGLKDKPRDQLLRFIREEHWGDSGIVYRISRKDVDETAEWLRKQGVPALPYHAGLPAQTRSQNQTKFLKEEGIVMVATIAFGMGIDKPDVRFVAHLDLPKSMESYYQETGRAGRDGLASQAWMVYGLQDVARQRSMLLSSELPADRKLLEGQKLSALLGLCETATCRRQVLLAYFGEELAEPCGNCDTCLEPVKTWDGTIAAQKAMSAIVRTGERFGSNHVIDVLMGEATEKVRQFGHDRLPTFGVGQDLSRSTWTSAIRQLVASGVLAVDMEQHSRICLTADSREVLKGERKVQLRHDPTPEKKSTKVRSLKVRASKTAPSGMDSDLFEVLRKERATLARELDIPPYMIASDRSLQDMAMLKPRDEVELLAVYGFGEAKVERFGQIFLSALRPWL